MSGIRIPIYRLPSEQATQVGQVRLVKDRKQRYYANGSPVSGTSVSGAFTLLECADGSVYYVRTADLHRVPGPKS